MDIRPFALPNCEPGEVRFEETRDIREIIVTFAKAMPGRIAVSYLGRQWPKIRAEFAKEDVGPFEFGWSAMDDWFNGEWRKAAVQVRRLSAAKASITFRGLSAEMGRDVDGYDVTFRRTLGFRLEGFDSSRIRRIEVLTTSAPRKARLRVELNAGRKTRQHELRFSGYNLVPGAISETRGVPVKDGAVRLNEKSRSFELEASLMTPAHRYCGDGGLLTFEGDKETFTIRVDDLAAQGPIWFADEGIYITDASDPTDFAAYRERIRGAKTIAERVLERPEQSYGGAYHGQVRPHPTNYHIGCKHARQRFWIEPNGDLLLNAQNARWMKGKDTPNYKSKGNAEFFFGIDRWAITARYNDPSPVLVYNIEAKKGALCLEQKSLAVPLMQSILAGEPMGDDTIVALVRFRVRNAGDSAETVEIPVGFSQEGNRQINNSYYFANRDENLIWDVPRDSLTARNGRLTGPFGRQSVLRAAYETTMQPKTRGKDLFFAQRLAPGESCELLLKIPFVSVEEKDELAALGKLKFDKSLKEVTRFWREEGKRGAQLRTPIDHLNAAHAAHLSHVEVSDVRMPDDPDLINTSVGSSTYGNFSNESCMIIQELEQRGLAEDCRRRLDLWVKYQGTVPQPGNFTDFDGMYFGAGGFECGHYNQHHGWVVWALAEHFLITGDRRWFDRIADSLIAGADWVFRQRRNTMTDLPHSRGWEHGFLPAGSLEDVTDFYYWLSTNSLTWRGTDSAARALEKAGHPEAARVRKEADAYRRDLIRGFETMRRHSPLVRLGDGRWVPHYPSRLYCRGRDLGWIREVLEGSVYLLISGLYDANSKAAGWILDDYQDNCYIRPPYGYHIRDLDRNFYNVGGFSCQPLLLAGLLPYLDRDEPEIYLWMFFNAWVSCYREEINGMIEHPAPVLGFNNTATFKTSDEANGIMWLRYLFVYATEDTLYLGRALPRAWMANDVDTGLDDVVTRFGTVSVHYRPEGRSIRLEASLQLRDAPGRIVARVRHPDSKSIRSVVVNGKRWTRFDPKKGDIDLTGLRGKVKVVANY